MNDARLEPFKEESFKPEIVVLGSQISKAPQPSLTAADSTTITTSGGAGTHIDASAAPVIENLRTRLGQVETALKNLNLIR